MHVILQTHDPYKKSPLLMSTSSEWFIYVVIIIIFQQPRVIN